MVPASSQCPVARSLPTTTALLVIVSPSRTDPRMTPCSKCCSPGHRDWSSASCRSKWTCSRRRPTRTGHSFSVPVSWSCTSPHSASRLPTERRSSATETVIAPSAGSPAPTASFAFAMRPPDAADQPVVRPVRVRAVLNLRGLTYDDLLSQCVRPMSGHPSLAPAACAPLTQDCCQAPAHGQRRYRRPSDPTRVSGAATSAAE